ncbi:MAG TPA: sterol desaturase family protein [Polyangiaceae bacterium]|nr:sterol desaturase family protein [Polyangiaceae bacterium]
MTLDDALGLAIPITYLTFLGVEARWPARSFPRVRGWRLIGWLALMMLMTINVALPLALPEPWLRSHRLLDGTRLGVVGGIVVGYAAVTFATYWWHRLEHRSDWVFRFIHQLHHSPVRMDVSGGAYLHPLDIGASIVLSLLVTVFVLGLDPVAAAIVGYVGAFYAMFQHLNVKTPPWLGYLIQRPESHCLHHERGVHARNYSDLPLWDIVFGTFHNPRSFAGEVGFGGPAPRRIVAMLLGVDVDRDAKRSEE